MATYCFPFDNASETELDRQVGSDVFAEYLRFMVGIDHGVYNKAGRAYQVTAAGSGYAVDVEGGIAFIRGRGRFDDAVTTVALEASEGLARIDRIVLRLNKPDRYIYLTVIKGVSAANPIAPALIRDDDIYDICLAEVKIDPVYSEILPENVTDTRLDTDLCGFMPQFGSVDTDGMFDQIQAAYDKYMDLLQQGIEDTVAGSLQAQIDDAAVYGGILYTTGTVHELTASLPADTCTVRFTADAAYVKGNTLTLNGESYTLMLPNGKALPDNAWISGAVVCLQINPETKTAFFNGGGADLSFVTAGAEQILSGFMGANAEGEPVEGGLVPAQVYTAPLSSFSPTTLTSTQQTVKFTYTMPDFVPDVILMVGRVQYTTASYSSGEWSSKTLKYTYTGYVDYINEQSMCIKDSGSSLYHYDYGSYGAWYSGYGGAFSSNPWYSSRESSTISYAPGLTLYTGGYASNGHPNTLDKYDGWIIALKY